MRSDSLGSYDSSRSFLSPCENHRSLKKGSNPEEKPNDSESKMFSIFGASLYYIMSHISIAIHGGAGTLRPGMMTDQKEAQYREALQKARDTGYAILEANGRSIDAVEASVAVLENSPLFNAGRGSVFTAEGTHEMDASIMCGKNREAGAVSLVHGITNPIQLARAVMDRSDHVFLAGAGAMEFARAQGFQMMDDDYFYDEYRYLQWKSVQGSEKFMLDHSEKDDRKFGTVGAVALDRNGDLAAATSTGGMTNKRYGRIGDSPIIGAGNFADNRSCAVSCTGSGEYFIRSVVAYDTACLMRYAGMDLAAAAKKAIQENLSGIQGDGGLIAIDAQGQIAMPFNTEGMYRACKSSCGKDLVAIYTD